MNLTRTKLIVASYLLLVLPLQAQDNPLLINITTLDQLYVIRYDANGDGTPDAATTATEKTAYRTAFGLNTTAGTEENNTCTGGCTGYELMNDLDFNDANGTVAGTPLSIWAKGCTTDCETGTQADGTDGNTGWEPIDYFNDQGTAGTSDDVTAHFSSRFHGNELTIRNLYVNRRSADAIYGGLFGYAEATLDSLDLRDVEVNVESTGSSSSAGGLVGYNDSSSSITACSATGDVSSSSSSSSSSSFSDSSSAGGLVGRSSSSITACSATGDISSSASRSSYAGGLVGFSDSGGSSISACYATGDVSSSSSSYAYAGGLVGRSNSSISACYATSDVSSSSAVSSSSVSYAGGLVGSSFSSSSSSSISACYATGDVSSASASASYAGGLVGRSRSRSSSISACYATGDVSSASFSVADSYAGGFVGLNGNSDGSNMSTITTSYYDSDATITGRARSNTTNAQTKAALQGPTDGTGIYATWIQLELDEGAPTAIDDRTQAGDVADDLIWDFGTATQYPALKIDFDGKDVTPTATVAEFGPQRVTKFRRATYDFFVRVDAASGAVIGTVRAMVADYDYTLSYSIVSQVVGTAAATTSGFAFDISNKTVRGVNVGELKVATGATLTVDQVYTLEVRVDDTNGGADMAEVRIEVTPGPPAAPTGLSATAVSDTQIDLAWEAPANTGGAEITAYKVQVSENGSDPWTVLHTTSNGATRTYSHTTGLTAGSTRHYRVAAINSVGTGAYSDPPTQATTHDVPAAPTGLMATAGNAQVTLSWTVPANGGNAITSYAIKVATTSGMLNSAATVNVSAIPNGATVGQTVSYVVTKTEVSSGTDLANGTTYHFQIAAVNSVGTGAYSDPPTQATTHDVPAAPTGLMATGGPAQVTLSWTVPANGGDAITSYAIKVATTSAALGAATAATVDVSAIPNGATAGQIVSYIVTKTEVTSGTDLAKGTTYHFQVAAVNSIGTGAYASIFTATNAENATAPAAPAGLMATPMSDTQIDLSWEAPNDTGGADITAYMIQVSENGSDSWTVLHTTSNVATRTYSHDMDLTAGTTRHYRVAAINSVGTGAYSDPPTQATTHDIPAVPTGLMATPMSDTQINLSWEAPTRTGGADITAYVIQVSENGSDPWTVLHTTSSETTLTYSHMMDLTAGSTRHYRVAAINSVGTGAYSDPPTQATTHDIPAVPTGLMATPMSDTQINLSWEAPMNTGGADITAYEIQVSEDGGTTFSNLHTTSNGTTLTYAHTMGLTAGTTRHYRVAAINSIGTGAYSDPPTQATTHDIPAVPTGLTAMAVRAAQIDLAWMAPTNTGGTDITGYEIQVSEDGSDPWTVLHTTSNGTTLTYAHTMGLTRGTTRHYRVAAINSVGTGAYSDPPVSATTTGGSDGATFSVPEAQDNLRVYPNPSSGWVRFAGLSATHSYLYKVYTLVGQEVLSGTLRSKEVDLSGLSSGQYILLLEDEGSELLRRRIRIVK